MRCVNGTGHVFKMKEKGRRNPWRVRYCRVGNE